MKPQTIQIFLPDGSPRSIKIAEITNRIVKAVLIPRNKFQEADKRDEIKNVGLYFLFGESEEKAKPIVYIGEAENCYDRIKQHNKKEFWNYVVIVISKTNSFTKSHAKYLENYCLTLASEIGRFEIENSNLPAKPFVTESMEADLMDSFDTMKILLTTLGYPLFEEISKAKVDKKEILFCKGRDAEAQGDYLDDGFVVFKGSTSNKELTNSAGPWVTSIRKKLVDDGVLKEEKNVFVFTQDYLFKSPSASAAAVLSRRANGWTEWKNREGKTLDELKRS